MEAIPIMKKCLRHYQDGRNPTGKCRNCNDTGKYKDGYYQIFTMPNGAKIGFITDTIK